MEWSVCRVRVPRSSDSRYLLVLPSSLEMQDVVDQPGGPQVLRFDFDGGEFWRATIFDIANEGGMVCLSILRVRRSIDSRYLLVLPSSVEVQDVVDPPCGPQVRRMRSNRTQFSSTTVLNNVDSNGDVQILLTIRRVRVQVQPLARSSTLETKETTHTTRKKMKNGNERLETVSKTSSPLQTKSTMPRYPRDVPPSSSTATFRRHRTSVPWIVREPGAKVLVRCHGRARLLPCSDLPLRRRKKHLGTTLAAEGGKIAARGFEW